MEQVKVQGERWFPSETRFSDEAKALWGDWYCDSEIGRLRAVLMRRPGKEIEGVTVNNYETFRWKAPMEVDRAREQHDALAQIPGITSVNVTMWRNNGRTGPTPCLCGTKC